MKKRDHEMCRKQKKKSPKHLADMLSIIYYRHTRTHTHTKLQSNSLFSRTQQNKNEFCSNYSIHPLPAPAIMRDAPWMALFTPSAVS